MPLLAGNHSAIRRYAAGPTILTVLSATLTLRELWKDCPSSDENGRLFDGSDLYICGGTILAAHLELCTGEGQSWGTAASLNRLSSMAELHGPAEGCKPASGAGGPAVPIRLPELHAIDRL
jgi:hypothetical protein